MTELESSIVCIKLQDLISELQKMNMEFNSYKIHAHNLMDRCQENRQLLPGSKASVDCSRMIHSEHKFLDKKYARLLELVNNHYRLSSTAVSVALVALENIKNALQEKVTQTACSCSSCTNDVPVPNPLPVSFSNGNFHILWKK